MSLNLVSGRPDSPGSSVATIKAAASRHNHPKAWEHGGGMVEFGIIRPVGGLSGRGLEGREVGGRTSDKVVARASRLRVLAVFRRHDGKHCGAGRPR
jgi:hypothetical protein